MKQKIALLIIFSFLFTACGSKGYEPIKNPNYTENNNAKVENITESENVIESEENITTNLDYEVDVILQAYMFDDSGIDAYIEQLKTENPDGKFSVYNDEYFISTITESERLEYINSMNENQLDEAFSDLINNEQYNGAFINIEYDDKLQNFKLYVNKEAYEQNIFACSMGSSFLINAISDSYQAYSLIKPEDRIINIVIIDNQTGNIIE